MFIHLNNTSYIFHGTEPSWLMNDILIWKPQNIVEIIFEHRRILLSPSSEWNAPENHSSEWSILLGHDNTLIFNIDWIIWLMLAFCQRWLELIKNTISIERLNVVRQICKNILYGLKMLLELEEWTIFDQAYYTKWL